MPTRTPAVPAAPRFAPLLAPRPAEAAAFDALAAGGSGVALFEVVAEGVFLGRRYGVGDVVVCRGSAAHGEATVLVAVGHGRPRLGRRWNGRWLGDAGEPCADARWRSAGKLVGRVVAGEGLVELFDGSMGASRGEPAAAAKASALPRPAAGAHRGREARQLSLFAA